MKLAAPMGKVDALCQAPGAPIERVDPGSPAAAPFVTCWFQKCPAQSLAA